MKRFPQIPKTIRGAGGSIKIRQVKHIKHSDGDECWGQWDDATRIIRLDRSASPQHKWKILFHELTHAALKDAGIENLLSGEAVESICDALATSHLQAMRGMLEMKE